MFAVGKIGKVDSPDSDETTARTDLVSKRATDLGGSEGDSTIVEFEKTVEVDEVALGRFWSEITVVVSRNLLANGQDATETILLAL